MAEVNEDLIREIVKQVISESKEKGTSPAPKNTNTTGKKRIFAYSIRKDEEPYV